MDGKLKHLLNVHAFKMVCRVKLRLLLKLAGQQKLLSVIDEHCMINACQPSYGHQNANLIAGISFTYKYQQRPASSLMPAQLLAEVPIALITQ